MSEPTNETGYMFGCLPIDPDRDRKVRVLAASVFPPRVILIIDVLYLYAG